MNETKPPLVDDELIRRIRDAFDQQAIPDCPIEDDWLGLARQDRAVQIYRALTPHFSRGATWMASLLSLAAVVGIAMVVFGSNGDRSKLAPPRDEFSPADDWVAQQGDRSEEPSVVSQNPKPLSGVTSLAEDFQDPGSPAFLDVINAANDFLTHRNDKPDFLIEQLHKHYAIDRSALQSVFRAIGVPAGIISVRRGVDRRQSWAQGKGQIAFTYGLEFPQALDDLTRLINAYCGEEIVDDLLDGLRDEVDGPQIDFRNDFFPLLDGRLILIVSTQPESFDVSPTIALSVKDRTEMWRLVNQAHRLEPESSRQSYKNVEIRVVAKKGARQQAWCIVENHLIIGDLQEVQPIIDRLNGM